MAFAVVSLFQIVRSPFGTIPQALAVYSQVQTSFERLSAFFELPTDSDGNGDEASRRRRGGGGSAEPGLIQVTGVDFRWPMALGKSAADGAGLAHMPSVKEIKQMKPVELQRLMQTSYEEGLNAKGSWGGSGGVGKGPSDGGNFRLQDVWLSVAPGELVMCVGSVGSGKSSLMAGLLGLLEANPASGAAEAKPGSGGDGKLRVGGSVAYCTQQPFVLSGTIRDNILFGHPYNRQRFADAVSRCCLARDINQMPDGEDTIVGERGTTLSGGQKARLAMARAAYARADVVILDDPLAAVDSDVSASLMDCAILGYEEGPGTGEGGMYDSGGVDSNIDCSFSRATCVLVTAQLHNCHLADTILVMAEGKLLEQGSYDELAHNPRSKFSAMLSESEQNVTSHRKNSSPRNRAPRRSNSSGHAKDEALAPAAASDNGAKPKAKPKSSPEAPQEARKTGSIARTVVLVFAPLLASAGCLYCRLYFARVSILCCLSVLPVVYCHNSGRSTRAPVLIHGRRSSFSSRCSWLLRCVSFLSTPGLLYGRMTS